MQLPLAPWNTTTIRRQDTRHAGASGSARSSRAALPVPLPRVGLAVGGREEGEMMEGAAAWPGPRHPSNRGAW